MVESEGPKLCDDLSCPTTPGYLQERRLSVESQVLSLPSLITSLHGSLETVGCELCGLCDERAVETPAMACYCYGLLLLWSATAMACRLLCRPATVRHC